MTKIDTSTERAEQLAKRLKRDIDWRPGSLCAEAAATLRALAAERDALKAERAAFVRRETADMENDLREANDKLVDVIAERDALRALLYEARHSGLIYWEPQTDRGRVAMASMLARIDAALAGDKP